jgi:hypothetical protein
MWRKNYSIYLTVCSRRAKSIKKNLVPIDYFGIELVEMLDMKLCIRSSIF